MTEGAILEGSLETAREREAALRAVIDIIAENRGDERPVFDAILSNALTLCNASSARLHMVNEEGTEHWMVAASGEKLHIFDEGERHPLDSPLTLAQAMREGRTIAIDDLRDDDLYRSRNPTRVRMVEKEGVLSFVAVPMLSGGRTMGCLALHRKQVDPFTPDEIALAETFAAQAVIAIENVRQFRELQTRLEREGASREILAVISRSRDNETPVFETILENAARLCKADDAGLHLLDDAGENLVFVAQRGLVETAFDLGTFRQPVDEARILPRALVRRAAVQIVDLADTEEYRAGNPARVRLVDEDGLRTMLAVPLLDGEDGRGVLALWRSEVKPFTQDEITLVETFAAQAVIAIDNVRQFRELQIRLEREAATREILEVISHSRDDEHPVFEAILENASRLCAAPLAFLTIAEPDGEHAIIAAHRGARPAFAETLAGFHEPIEDSPLIALRPIAERAVIRQTDIADDDLYRQRLPLRVAMVEEEGIRSILGVPLLHGGRGIGSIVLYRREVNPFSDDEVALIESFAAQAVIAIENVRQFRELQERLEREAASREILGVISHSRADELPVFKTILENAARLCDAPMALLGLLDEDAMRFESAAHIGAREDYFDFLRKNPPANDPDRFIVARAMRDREVVHIHDITDVDVPGTGERHRDEAVTLEEMRTILFVPLISGDRSIGCILLYRREVSPFSEDQIALVETFAAQAVIAIENVRQFRELQARLEREAASREILQVISRSRDDEMGVFDVILANGARLCDAPLAYLRLVNAAGTHLELVAHHGTRAAYLAAAREMPLKLDATQSETARAVAEKRVVHVHDLGSGELYARRQPNRVHAVETEGMRTLLIVPLLSGETCLGEISLYRREVAPFTSDQIALVETFAAQAVIAIENVRQFRELERSNADLTSALERQTATAEVLDVISQSQSELQPVMKKIAVTAQELCHSDTAAIWWVRGNRFELGAMSADDAETVDFFREHPPELGDGSAAGRAVVAGRSVHVTDVLAEGQGIDHALIRRNRTRAILAVPMLAVDGAAVGAIVTSRKVPGPFADEQIALVETFADQAAIAIENVRLFTELQERLEREAATREILEVISDCREDEGPVFDAILRNAQRLCNAPMAMLSRVNEERTHVTVPAHRGARPGFSRILETWSEPIERTDYIAVRAVVEPEVYRMDDLADSDLYRRGDPRRVEMVDVEGIRSLIMVPLIRDGQGIGGIALYRREVNPFSDDEVAVVQSFAAQAVIAIENVRQFRELQTRLEREKASREILGIISEHREDDQPVFEAILENAARLCHSSMARLHLLEEDGEFRRLVAHWGDSLHSLKIGEKMPMDGGHPISQTIRTGQLIHVEDLTETDLYKGGDELFRRLVEREGLRSLLTVPLLRSGDGFGCIALSRRENKPFSDDEIALAQTFAAQAVIAIENVRQFREVQTRLEREAASRKILEIISRSRDDEQPVFDAVLQSASRLCGAHKAGLLLGHPESDSLVLEALYDPDLSKAELDAMIAEANDPPMKLDPEEHISASAIRSGRVVEVEDLSRSEAYLKGEHTFRSMVDGMGSRSVVCVPLRTEAGPVGAIMLHRRAVRPFNADEIALVETFASQAVIAIENVRQFRALEASNAEVLAQSEELQSLNISLEARVEAQVGEIERMGKLRSFLPAAVADAVVSSGSEQMLKSHRALLGILFCDIRGFTAFCETAEPEETIEVLQTYHREMGRLIAAHGAGVDHRMGDGIMVLFNDPLPCEDPAGEAVRLAIAMRERMVDLCQGWKKLGHRLGFGVGISLGYATVGMVGYEERAEYTASGTAVNLAARLCDQAADGEILLSPRAAIAVEDEVSLEPGGLLDLKGLATPVEVMRVVGTERA